MPRRQRSAAVANATPRSAEASTVDPRARLLRDKRELAAAQRDVERQAERLTRALRRLAEARAWAEESSREAP